MIVSFDFDGTLTRPEVSLYAKELIEKGVDVWVTTARYDELQKHLYPINPTNEDLYKVIGDIGIPKHKVKFMNMGLKADYLDNTFVIWHLDDDDVETKSLNKVVGIDVKISDWKEICNKLLGL